MSDPAIARLRTELERLDAAIAGLAGMPEAQALLRTQRAECADQLARLAGRAPAVSIDQSGQQGGVSFGAYNRFAGDVSVGDVAGGDINKTQGPLAVAIQAPIFRLVLTDRSGEPCAQLRVGQEALLQLEWAGAAIDLPPLTLLVAAEGVTWRASPHVELRPQPGQPTQLPRWPLVAERAGPLTIRAVALAGAALLQSFDLSINVVAGGEEG